MAAMKGNVVCKGHVGGIYNQVFLLYKLWDHILCNGKSRNILNNENISYILGLTTKLLQKLHMEFAYHALY